MIVGKIAATVLVFIGILATSPAQAKLPVDDAFHGRAETVKIVEIDIQSTEIAGSFSNCWMHHFRLRGDWTDLVRVVVAAIPTSLATMASYCAFK